MLRSRLSQSFSWIKRKAGFGSERDDTDNRVENMSIISNNDTTERTPRSHVLTPGINYQEGLFTASTRSSPNIDRRRGESTIEPLDLSYAAPASSVHVPDLGQQTTTASTANINGSSLQQQTSASNIQTGRSRFNPSHNSTPVSSRGNEQRYIDQSSNQNFQTQMSPIEPSVPRQITQNTIERETTQNSDNQTQYEQTQDAATQMTGMQNSATQMTGTQNSGNQFAYVQNSGTQTYHPEESTIRNSEQNSVVQNSYKQSQTLKNSACNSNVSFQKPISQTFEVDTLPTWSSDGPIASYVERDTAHQQTKLPHRKVMMPEQYNGEGDWEEYISAFNDISSWNRWNKEEKAVQLGLHLSGIARTIKTDLPSKVTQDFDLFVLTLKKYFSCEGREAAFQAEYRQRRRGKSEKLSDFGHELSRLCKKAFPKLDRSAREQFVLEHFKLGLDPELRKHVQFSHPDTLEEAIVSGLEFEAMDEDRTKARKPINVSANAITAVDSDTNSVDQMAKMIEQNQLLVDNVTKLCQARRQNYRDIECYNCKKKGHVKRFCPFNSGQEVSEKTSSSESPLN